MCSQSTTLRSVSFLDKVSGSRHHEKAYLVIGAPHEGQGPSVWRPGGLSLQGRIVGKTGECFRIDPLDIEIVVRVGFSKRALGVPVSGSKDHVAIIGRPIEPFN